MPHEATPEIHKGRDASGHPTKSHKSRKLVRIELNLREAAITNVNLFCMWSGADRAPLYNPTQGQKKKEEADNDMAR